MRAAFLGGLLLGSARLVLGLVVMWVAQSEPEIGMVVIGDLPTLLTYLLMKVIGRPNDIVDAGDMFFLTIACISWFFWGAIIGAMIHKALGRARLSSS